MVEVIIAMLILTIGVLGLASTTGHIVRQISLGDLMTERSVAFQTIIDRLQSLPYDSVGSGADSVGARRLSEGSGSGLVRRIRDLASSERRRRIGPGRGKVRVRAGRVGRVPRLSPRSEA